MGPDRIKHRHLKRSVMEALARSKASGSWEKRTALTNEPVYKELQQSTQNNYLHALEMWDGFLTTLDDGWVKDPNDLRTAKAFASLLASGIPGRERGSKPCQSSIVQSWKNFTAAWEWDRRGCIDPKVKTSTRNYIKGELQKEMELPLRKRVRRFAAVPHFIRLGTQLWGRDWATYGRPGDRVDLWAEIQLNVFTSARVGEYIESTARAGSGRGLRYRDVSFGIFRNEYGDAEFAMQVVKDAKGMTFLPCRRPEHSLHEGLEERPLFCNPILTHLAMFIAKGAFRDYKTMEQLLALEPSDKEEMFLLRWEPRMLDLPIYQRKDGKIESASTFCTRLRALARRAGYACPPTIHDFRAEALFLIDRFYSPSQRMRQAGHRDERTYTEYYAPTNPGTDGQGSYFGGTRRTLVNERFRALTVAWNPELYQSLPAEKMFELEKRADFASIQQQLELCLSDDNPKVAEKRKQLQAQKRQLIADELRRLQNDQPREISKDTSGPGAEIGHQRTMFPRIRNLMGPRHRLAANILLTAPIRSDVGRAVLSDMIALYRQTSEVEARPGLEPERCCCVSEWRNSLKSNSRDVKWSRHVYGCVKKHLQATRSFGEFCFLCNGSNAWYDDATEWEKHCQFHLDSSLPTQCNPFSYDKCIASPGFCPWCLGDTSMDATSRMRHFVEARDWRAHIDNHILALEESVSMDSSPFVLHCPHPRPQCEKETFDSVQRLVWHLQDVHCLMRATSCPGKFHKSCHPSTLDEVDEGEYDDREEYKDDLPDLVSTLDLPLYNNCSTTSSFSTASSSPIASPLSPYISWSDDYSQYHSLDSTSYSPGKAVQNMPVEELSHYTSEVVGDWIGYDHVSYASMGHLPAYPNGSYSGYNNGCLVEALEPLTLVSPSVQPWNATPGYDSGFPHQFFPSELSWFS